MKDQDLPPRRRVLAKRMLGAAAVAVVALSAAAYFSGPAQTQANAPAGDARTSSESAPEGKAEPSGTPLAPAIPDSGPTPTETPGPDVTPDAPTPLPAEQAGEAVQKFLDASVAVDPTGPGTNDDLTAAASGAILAETQNDTQELEANGWTREGAATIEALTIIRSDSQSDPATVVAQACVDSREVRTLDADGAPVGTSGDSSQRALNLYTLQYLSGAWTVVARSFPDEFAC